MRLLDRHDTSLALALVASALVIFQRPLHLLIDVAKSYMGAGVIPWAFPFSMQTVELGWYYPEDSVFLMLPSLGVIAGVELLCRALKARRPASP